jgi:hypothetical protein
MLLHQMMATVSERGTREPCYCIAHILAPHQQQARIKIALLECNTLTTINYATALTDNVTEHRESK